jgi:hypothetical protein
MLWQFTVGGPTRRERAQQAMNELLSDVEVSRAIRDFARSEQAAPPEPPPIIEHPIDEEWQTGDSRLLGGPMEIRSPWSDEEE